MEKIANIRNIMNPQIQTRGVFLFWETIRNAGTNEHKDFLYISLAAIIGNIFSWLLVVSFLKKETLDIILHYNIFSGIDYQGDRTKLFTIPAIGLAIILMNFMITRYVQSKDRFISYLLLVAAFISQIFVIIAITAIILVNSKGPY